MTMTSTAQLRKIKKPMIERRRRERINDCLQQLKSIILDFESKEPSRYSKMEKADILEMTVKHLKEMHMILNFSRVPQQTSHHSNNRTSDYSQPQHSSVGESDSLASLSPRSSPASFQSQSPTRLSQSTSSNDSTGDDIVDQRSNQGRQYIEGFSECASKIRQFLVTKYQPDLHPDTRMSLSLHLDKCVDNSKSSMLSETSVHSTSSSLPNTNQSVLTSFNVIKKENPMHNPNSYDRFSQIHVETIKPEFKEADSPCKRVLNGINETNSDKSMVDKRSRNRTVSNNDVAYTNASPAFYEPSMPSSNPMQTVSQRLSSLTSSTVPPNAMPLPQPLARTCLIAKHPGSAYHPASYLTTASTPLCNGIYVDFNCNIVHHGISPCCTPNDHMHQSLISNSNPCRLVGREVYHANISVSPRRADVLPEPMICNGDVRISRLHEKVIPSAEAAIRDVWRPWDRLV